MADQFPGPTKMVLSPAAQAVLYAANRASSYGPDDCLNDSRFIAAAALRAAADQVAPEEPDYMRDAVPSTDWWDKHDQVRSELLSLANELEATP